MPILVVSLILLIRSESKIYQIIRIYTYKYIDFLDNWSQIIGGYDSAISHVDITVSTSTDQFSRRGELFRR